ncbi:Semaphorin-2A [Halotydeus destructor]|nr:Semaphorin-2A [Halotydeus destructor]
MDKVQRDKVFRVSLSNINRTRCEADSLTLEPSNVNSCVSKGKSGHYECRNHVRVIQVIGGNKLYICGTNAHAPKDYVVHANLSHLSAYESFPGIGNGIAKCPFDPDDNATAIWVEKGNPGSLPGLYSGSAAEFTKADTVIFRTDLYNLTTGQKAYPFKRTIKYDSKWLDKPHFVGSFDIGDWVYFFFRESAVEYINCGKNTFSRVARLCKRDTGGKNILSKNWASFLKARLNCSIPGEFPFYFNEIQHVFKHPDDDRRFYAVFSTSMNGLLGSAICSFSLDAIQEVFNGKFKEQATSSSAWLPVLTSKVPEPRPGVCVNDTQSLPDSVLNFIRGHPLMDSAVSQDNGKPVFYKRDVVFTRIVVDKIEVEGVFYTVYYAGTSSGLVYKVVEWTDATTGEARSNVADVFEATSPEPVRAMEISSKHKSLYVSSDSQLRQLDLFMCKARYENCIRCVRDPYCGWDRSHSECKPYINGLLQDITESSREAGICDECVRHKELRVNWGQSIHLACPVRLPDMENLLTRHGPLRWYYYRSERSSGFEVFPRRDKFVHTSDNGLVVLAVSDREGGRYECKLGADIVLCRYNVSVDAKTCTSPNEAEYRKVYSDWCHEFERYKQAMKSWQLKQAKCQSDPSEIANSLS